MPENFGAYHLANAANDLYEPMRTNAFRFIVTDIDNLVRADSDDVIKNAQELLEFSVVSFTVPTFTQEPIIIRRGNSVMKAAGIPSFNEGELVIKDYMGADGKSILLAWQNLSYNVKEQTIGLMSEYKKDCYLVEYSPDYSRIVRQWILHKCWVSGISQDAFNVEEGGERQLSATIQYDWAEQILSDEE